MLAVSSAIPTAAINAPNTACVLVSVKLPPVEPTKLIPAPRRGMSAVTVPEVKPEITTLSCGSGTRLVQFAAVDQVPVVLPLHVCVAAVVNVIPELP